MPGPFSLAIRDALADQLEWSSLFQSEDRGFESHPGHKFGEPSGVSRRFVENSQVVEWQTHGSQKAGPTVA